MQIFWQLFSPLAKLFPPVRISETPAPFSESPRKISESPRKILQGRQKKEYNMIQKPETPKPRNPETIISPAKRGDYSGVILLSYSPYIYYKNLYPFFSSLFPQKIGKKWCFFWVFKFLSFYVLK